MEKIGLESSELERLFAQIKQGKQELDAKIYNAYLPLIDVFSKKFAVKKENVQDLYNEVFSYLYNTVMQGVVQPKDFTLCFENVLAKQCIKYKSKSKNEFSSELLSLSYAKNVASREAEEERRAENNKFVNESLLYLISVLNRLEKDHEYAEKNGLTQEKINMIRDLNGLNKEHKKYNAAQMAEKYHISESRVTAVLASGLKKLREMKEFQSIRSHLR